MADDVLRTGATATLPNVLLRISLHPILGILVKCRPILFELVGNGGLNGVVRVGLDQECLYETQDGDDLVRGLPFLGTQQAQAHRALVIVAYVWVVNLRLKADDRRLEGIFGGESDLELEVASL